MADWISPHLDFLIFILAMFGLVAIFRKPRK